MGKDNSKLRQAAGAKQDEYYTQLTDIEKELQYYRGHFRDKVVFCNCDDPEWSNFWKFFSVRFNLFGLKKLIATHYENDKPSYMLSMERMGDETPTVIKSLQGNGDFRSEECVALLKEADIVVTNPPFSLFREYVAQLMEFDKKFVIIGNNNAITYKEIFPLLKDGKMWLGYRSSSGGGWYSVTKEIEAEIRSGERKATWKEDDGLFLVNCPMIWFTNLDIPKRHEDVKIFRHYTPEAYPKYDHYDAINVNKVVDIPCDYDGVMGVPISFLDKHNPDQFEIIDALNRYALLDSQGTNEMVKKMHSHSCNINGKATYFRILIRKKVPTNGN